MSKVPLLIIPVLLYNALSIAGLTDDAVLFSVRWGSGAGIAVTPGYLCVAIAMVLLNGELAKATRSDRAGIVEQLWSIALLLLVLVEFLVVPYAQTAGFAILLLACASDVASGMVISIVAARRDVAH